MPELTLGVDLSDFVARVVVVNDAGQVLSRGQVPLASANLTNGVRDAARRGIAGAGGKVSALAVALPQAGDPVPVEIAAALSTIWLSVSREARKVAAVHLLSIPRSESGIILDTIRLECKDNRAFEYGGR